MFSRGGIEKCSAPDASSGRDPGQFPCMRHEPLVRAIAPGDEHSNRCLRTVARAPSTASHLVPVDGAQHVVVKGRPRTRPDHRRPLPRDARSTADFVHHAAAPPAHQKAQRRNAEHQEKESCAQQRRAGASDPSVYSPSQPALPATRPRNTRYPRQGRRPPHTAGPNENGRHPPTRASPAAWFRRRRRRQSARPGRPAQPRRE